MARPMPDEAPVMKSTRMVLTPEFGSVPVGRKA